MKLATFFTLSSAALGLTLSTAPRASACGVYGNDRIDPHVVAVLESMDKSYEQAAAIAALRARGAEGLAALLRADRALKGQARYSEIVDQVAQQKDALRSRLYWYTDLDKARAAAAETGRPVLSLRLLGELDEEFSCANSRLFREVLYADPKVGDYLREHFVLHWKSVRPVPVMTIDFGDGRVLKRTITGNSAHYVLDHKGRVADALPGLYTPAKFLENLAKAESFVRTHSGQCSRLWPASLTRYHEANLATLQTKFLAHLESSGLADVSNRLSTPIQITDLTQQEWAVLAANTPEMIKVNLAAVANQLTVGKGRMETPLIAKVQEANFEARKLTNLKAATAEDSVRNEYVFHRRIHERLSKSGGWRNVEKLNSWVYAELFQTPESDPWLGLHTPEVFTGLEGNGIVASD